MPLCCVHARAAVCIGLAAAPVSLSPPLVAMRIGLALSAGISELMMFNEMRSGLGALLTEILGGGAYVLGTGCLDVEGTRARIAAALVAVAAFCCTACAVTPRFLKMADCSHLLRIASQRLGLRYAVLYVIAVWD